MSETKTYRIIIAGSRDFENYEVVNEVVKTKAAAVIKAIKEKEPEAKIEIVSGGARGVDSLGERFAREYGYKLWRFPADWNAYGRAAGPIRNRQMLEFAMERKPVLIAFWNGVSRGTSFMGRTGRSVYARKQDRKYIRELSLL